MRSHPHPDDGFFDGIKTGLAYWYGETHRLDDLKIAALDQERNNLFQLLDFGLKLPQTWQISAKILVQLYPLFDRRGYWKDGQIMLETAQNYSSGTDSPLHIRLSNQLGNFYRMQTNVAQAKKIHESAIQRAKKQNDPHLLAACLIGLQYDCRSMGNYEDAIQYGDEALRLLQEDGEGIIFRIDALRGMGQILNYQGEHKNGHKYIEEAIRLARINGEPIVLVRSLIDMIDLLLNRDDEEKLLGLYEECQYLLQDTVNEFDKVSLNTRIGIYHFNHQNWEAAEIAFREALSTNLKHSGHLESRVILLNNLGNVFLNQGKFLDAEAHLKGSLELRPQIGDEVGWANTEGTLAELYSKMGRVPAAKILYAKAIEKLERYPDNAWGQGLLDKFKKQNQRV
jgi:tetratricopeptide (TPR) repeat protein